MGEAESIPTKMQNRRAPNMLSEEKKMSVFGYSYWDKKKEKRMACVGVDKQ